MANAVAKLASPTDRRRDQQQQANGGASAGGAAVGTGAAAAAGPAVSVAGGGGVTAEQKALMEANRARALARRQPRPQGHPDQPRAADDTPIDASAARTIATKRAKSSPKPKAAPTKKKKKKKKKKSPAAATDGPAKAKRARSAYMIYLAEEGRATAKDAAPEGTPAQELMRLGAALWKKMSAKQKAPWEKQAAAEKVAQQKAARQEHDRQKVEEKATLAEARELELRRKLAGLLGGDGEAARELADELWSSDEDENSELVAGLHTVGGGGATGGTLPLPSWRQPGGGVTCSGGSEAGGAVGGGRFGGGRGDAKRQRKSSQAASVDLF